MSQDPMIADAQEPTDAQDAREDGAGTLPLSLLYDVSMPVAIELGRTRLSVREILELGRGSVVQLDRLAGEPVDVLVGERRLAEGEVVVVDDQFAVRITKLVGPPLQAAEAQA